MSTRGYYGIKKKGELKGSYNHWDSYPSGLGKDLVDELNKIKKDDRLKVLNETFDYIKLIDSNTPPTEEQKEVCQKANVVDFSNKVIKRICRIVNGKNLKYRPFRNTWRV